MKDEFVEYFESLGYQVDWDFHAGQHWWEIQDHTGTLMLQIDKGVPLKYIISDMVEFHTGKPLFDEPGPSYVISGEETEETKLLYKKVYENLHIRRE